MQGVDVKKIEQALNAVVDLVNAEGQRYMPPGSVMELLFCRMQDLTFDALEEVARWESLNALGEQWESAAAAIMPSNTAKPSDEQLETLSRYMVNSIETLKTKSGLSDGDAFGYFLGLARIFAEVAKAYGQKAQLVPPSS